MKYYDADYIIRKNNEYEEQMIFNHPAHQKLLSMIDNINKQLAIQNEKLKLQREKLAEKRRQRMLMNNR